MSSYLLFEPGFVKALMAMGGRDAYARKTELLAFFDPKLSKSAGSYYGKILGNKQYQLAFSAAD